MSIRAGIVGAGLMGRWHAAAIKSAGGQLVAIADFNLKAAHQVAAPYDEVVLYDEVAQMLRQSQLDVLHICTPLASHTQIAKQAISSGVHILIEKPITPNAAQTEHLVKLATENNLLLCPVYQFLFQDGTQKAKALLPRLGHLLHLEGTFYSAGGVGATNEQLDAIVADILPHPLSLMQHFLPTGLLPISWLTERPTWGELRALGNVSGTTLSISISMNARPTVCSFKLVGTAGTIHLDMFHGYAFMEPAQVSKRRKMIRPFDLALRRLGMATLNLGLRAIRRQPAYPGLWQLTDLFYRAIQNKKPSPIAPHDVLTIARAREQLRQGIVK